MEKTNSKRILKLLWKKKITIMLIVAIFAMIGTIYSVGFITPEYTSSTKIVLPAADKKIISTYAELAKSKNVIRQVISNLKLNIDEEVLSNDVVVNTETETEIIEISVTNEKATNASKITKEIVEVTTQKVSEIYSVDNIYVLEEAEINNKPTNVNHEKDISIFAGIGLIIAIVSILISNVIDTTIKTTEEIENILNLQVLASIPEYTTDAEKGGKRK